MIQINSVKENGQTVLRLVGDLTIYAVSEARQELVSQLALGPFQTLDLSEVDEIDTSGTQLLLWLRQEVESRGQQLPFVHHSSAVIEVFDLLGVTTLFGDQILIGPS